MALYYSSQRPWCVRRHYALFSPVAFSIRDKDRSEHPFSTTPACHSDPLLVSSKSKQLVCYDWYGRLYSARLLRLVRTPTDSALRQSSSQLGTIGTLKNKHCCMYRVVLRSETRRITFLVAPARLVFLPSGKKCVRPKAVFTVFWRRRPPMWYSR
jgi:hypothetical protein